jgi:hypothetical protein
MVERILIRASRGAAATRYLSPDQMKSNDRCYATVEFKRQGAARAALGLSGIQIAGIPISICLTPADLPEVQDIMNDYGWSKALTAGRRRIR